MTNIIWRILKRYKRINTIKRIQVWVNPLKRERQRKRERNVKRERKVKRENDDVE